ncbi:MAG: hypothetical protein ACO3CD_05035 [Candidatus Nanopelagicaceae bacterium]
MSALKDCQIRRNLFIKPAATGEVAAPHPTFTFCFFIMFKFQSSAIENITDVQDEQVTITFVGGRNYTYKVADPSTFVNDLNTVIEKDDSVGRFINSAIRSEQLLSV